MIDFDVLFEPIPFREREHTTTEEQEESGQNNNRFSDFEL